MINLDTELALRAALNVLRDNVECGRMPSGVPLAPEAVDLHEEAVQHLEAMLRKSQGPQGADRSPLGPRRRARHCS